MEQPPQFLRQAPSLQPRRHLERSVSLSYPFKAPDDANTLRSCSEPVLWHHPQSRPSSPSIPMMIEPSRDSESRQEPQEATDQRQQQDLLQHCVPSTRPPHLSRSVSASLPIMQPEEKRILRRCSSELSVSVLSQAKSSKNLPPSPPPPPLSSPFHFQVSEEELPHQANQHVLLPLRPVLPESFSSPLNPPEDRRRTNSLSETILSQNAASENLPPSLQVQLSPIQEPQHTLYSPSRTHVVQRSLPSPLNPPEDRPILKRSALFSASILSHHASCEVLTPSPPLPVNVQPREELPMQEEQQAVPIQEQQQQAVPIQDQQQQAVPIQEQQQQADQHWYSSPRRQVLFLSQFPLPLNALEDRHNLEHSRSETFDRSSTDTESNHGEIQPAGDPPRGRAGDPPGGPAEGAPGGPAGGAPGGPAGDPPGGTAGGAPGGPAGGAPGGPAGGAPPGGAVHDENHPEHNRIFYKVSVGTEWLISTVEMVSKVIGKQNQVIRTLNLSFGIILLILTVIVGPPPAVAGRALYFIFFFRAACIIAYWSVQLLSVVSNTEDYSTLNVIISYLAFSSRTAESLVT